MRVTIGRDGLSKTHQADFPETVTTIHALRGSETEGRYCNGEARIAFVVHERTGKDPDEGPFVCALHENKYDEGEAWLHDCCAVAVYFCKKCLQPVAQYNQG
jgi:hypothetical protein